MRTLSWPDGWWPRLFILGVILVFLGGCATLQNLTKSSDKEFKVYYGGDYKSIIVPSEFYDVDPDEVYPIPTGIITITLVWTNADDLSCGLVSFMYDFYIYGCFVEITENEFKYWIYDREGKPQPVMEDEFNVALEVWDGEGPPSEPEIKTISI